jgi:P22 coat protein - gene protein 5
MSTEVTLSPSLITKESLVILVNNLVMAGRVNRQFESQFGAKIGTQLTVRKPNKFIVSETAALQVQDINEPSTSITISNQSHIDFQFSTAALTLVIEEFRERYLKPALEKLANRIDRGVLANVPQIYNEVGTPTVVPANFAALALVARRLDEEAAPQNDRTMVLNPAAYWSIAVGISAVFVNSVAEPGFKGYVPNLANMEIYLDQNIGTQQTGAYGATAPTVFGSG